MYYLIYDIHIEQSNKHYFIVSSIICTHIERDTKLLLLLFILLFLTETERDDLMCSYQRLKKI